MWPRDRARIPGPGPSCPRVADDAERSLGLPSGPSPGGGPDASDTFEREAVQRVQPHMSKMRGSATFAAM